MSGITGLVMEPIRGARTRGFKGATIGLGKGILGLVCKPVAGTIKFLSSSIKGLANMPKSAYRRVLNMYKNYKKKKNIDGKFVKISLAEIER